jgi:hypothetical protein
MDNKDLGKVAKEATRQGWDIRPTTKGSVFIAPNGTRIAMHRLHGSSSPHALDHHVRRMRKEGFRWPPPK